MKKFFQITSILLLLVSLIGCPKDPKVTEQTGDLVGRVIFENENVTDFSNIFVTLSSKTDSGKVWNYTTDASGDFEFNKIPVGDYSVSAMSNASGNRRASTNVKILAKQTVTITDDLKLIAVGSISGKITIDGSANDVFGLDVFIAGKSYNAKVAEDGSYEISDIPAKEGYVLCVQKGEYIKEICKVDVQSENSTTVDYDIKPTDIKKNNSFNWLGGLKSAPETGNLYDAYYNETDGCSYIWNGEKWTLLAKAGLNGINGADGAKGEQGLPGKDGADGQDGANGKDGTNGKDGLSIIWQGLCAKAPENPQINWAYFNTLDGCSYIWNGKNWDLLAQAGCSHVFEDQWTILKEATEYVEGKRKTTCVHCNYEFEEIIPRLPIPVVNPEPYGTRVDNLNHIFNNQTLGTTTITMKRSEWNKLCENYRYFFKNENYVHAEKYEYEKDGQTWSIPNVGFRQRGNTSRFCPQGVDNGRSQGQANADWSPDYYAYAEQENDDYRQVHFKVDFEEFLEGDEELKMAGCMKGVALKRMDHSWGREIFCYDLFHKFGIWTAPRASHTRVILKFIEDETDNSITTVDYGVYEMFEEVNKQSLKARAQDEGETASNLWANNKGNLWKCSSDLTMDGLNQTGVEDIRIIFDDEGNPIDKVWNGYKLDLKTNKDELASAEAELHGFITELNALPTDTSDESIATIKAFYEKWFDMDFFLKTYAINILCGMDDDYWGNANNFYLYFDTGKKGTGKLYFIPFDYDNTLGCSIREGGFLQNPLEWGDKQKDRPLMDRAMLVPDFKQKFIELLHEVSDENLYWNFDRCSQQFLDWKKMLEPYAASPDLHDMISQKYWGDYTWQPSGYSLTSYSNNIYDATRYAIRGEENPNIPKISEVECNDGIRIEIKNIPEGAYVRRVFIDGTQVADSSLSETVCSSEFFYPYVENGKTYSVKVEFYDEKYNTIASTTPLEITPKGGLGDLNTKVQFESSFEGNKYNFPSEKIIIYAGSDNEVSVDSYTVNVFTKSWSFIGGRTSNNWIPSLELAETYPEADIMFQYCANLNVNDNVNGSYCFYFYQCN